VVLGLGHRCEVGRGGRGGRQRRKAIRAFLVRKCCKHHTTFNHIAALQIQEQRAALQCICAALHLCCTASVLAAAAMLAATAVLAAGATAAAAAAAAAAATATATAAATAATAPSFFQLQPRCHCAPPHCNLSQPTLCNFLPLPQNYVTMQFAKPCLQASLQYT